MKPPKIVILTDFSPLSLVVARFALKLAGPLKADFTLLHVVRLEGPAKANLRLKQIEKMLTVSAEEEGLGVIEKLRKEIKGEYTLRFKAVRAHTVTQAVLSYVAANPVNMVVMGSRGASAIKKARMGGTTVSVIDDCDVPVLAIPELAQYKNLQRMVYASDLKDVEKELEVVTEFAAIFGSHIHMIHVVPALDKDAEAARKAVEALLARQKYKKIDFQVIIDDNIPAAIDQFINDTKAELLTTFTHHLNLFEKMFALSVTRTLAYQGTIPLLALKRK